MLNESRFCVSVVVAPPGFVTSTSYAMHFNMIFELALGRILSLDGTKVLVKRVRMTGGD
jgi:hypothetical protein